jgi:hypothetical protein
MAIFSYSEYTSDAPKGGTQFTILPVGVYECSIVNCELKHNRASTGTYWAFQYVLDCMYSDSKYKDRYVWDNQTYTLQGKPDSERIGRMMLADICFAAGLQDGFDLEELPSLIVGKQLVLRLYHKKGLGGDMEAKVGTYYNTDGKHRSGSVSPLPRDKYITALPGAPSIPTLGGLSSSGVFGGTDSPSTGRGHFTDDVPF